MATNPDPVDEEELLLNPHYAAEGLLKHYSAGPLYLGEVEGLAEDITRLLTEKYNIPIGII